MKKIVYFIITILFITTCVFIACNNNDVEENNVQHDQQNEFFLQMIDRFELAGVINMIDNYTLKDEDVQAINKVSTILNEAPNSKIATLRIDYTDGAVVYTFTMPDQSMSVIKISQGELTRNFVCGAKTIQEKNYIFVNESGMESLIAFDSFMSNHLRASCDDLGSRRAGETFGDCFQRNWNNFCCDFIGCAAQIAAPHLIAIAIAIDCTC